MTILYSNDFESGADGAAVPNWTNLTFKNPCSEAVSGAASASLGAHTSAIFTGVANQTAQRFVIASKRFAFDMGLLIRCNPTSQYPNYYFWDVGGYIPGALSATLKMFVDGQETQLATFSNLGPSGTVAYVEALSNGSTHELRVWGAGARPDAASASFVDATHTSGTIGLRSDRSGDFFFDDLIYDDLVSGPQGTIYNLTLAGATYGTGKFGQARTAGSGTTPALPLGPAYTVESQIKTTDAGVGVAYCLSSSNWNGVTGGKWSAKYPTAAGTTELVSTSNVNDGAFHHIALCAGPSGGALFIDGALEATSAVAASDFNSGVEVGTFGGGYAFNGTIDELAFFSATKHSSTFTPPTAATSNTAANLVALYHFDNNALDSATLTGAATAVTLTGPTSGTTAVASTNFTVGANGTITGTVVVTPSDGGAGGAFTPTTRSLTSGTSTGTFTYTPSSTGAKTISVTNNGSLTNPSTITYTSNAAAPAAGDSDTVVGGTTVKIRGVGAGRTYASVTAFANYVRTVDCVADAVMLIGEVYGDQTLDNADLYPIASDAQHYAILRPAPGTSINDLQSTGACNYGTSGCELTVPNGKRLTLRNGALLTGFRLNMQANQSVLCQQGGSGTLPTIEHNRILANGIDAISNNAYQTFNFNDNLVLRSAAVGTTLVNNQWKGNVLRNTFVLLAGGTADSGVKATFGGDYRDNVFHGFAVPFQDASDASNNYTNLAPVNATGLIVDTVNAFFVSATSDFRPAVGLIGKAGAVSVSVNDVRNNNRGTAPDMGAVQATPAAVLTVAPVTTQTVDGSTLTIGGTTTGAPTTAKLSLTPATPANGAASYGPLDVTLGSGTFTVTIDDLASGNYLAPVITFTNLGGVASATGAVGFEVLGLGNLLYDPGTVAPATVVTWAPQTSGVAGVASAGFSVGLNGATTSTVRVTPDDAGAGGTFVPAYLDLTPSVTAGTFTYVRPTVGSSTITLTNNAALANPLSATYVAASAADTTAPAVTLSASSLSITAPGSYLLTAVASDNVGVARVEFYRNGTMAASDVAAPYTFAENVTIADNGTRVYTAKAYDAAGNNVTSAPLSVVINIAAGATPPAPTLAITTAVMNGKVLTATGTANLQGSGTLLAYLDPQPSGTPLGPYTVTVASGAWSYAPVLAVGQVQLRLVATANSQTATVSSATKRVLGLSGAKTLPTP